MPLYEFQCDKCGCIDEKLTKHDYSSFECTNVVNDEPNETVMKCPGTCIRILSRAGLVFEKKFYPNGKDWNETRREAWERPRSQE